jgi:glycosyltransferase involved in cell wall biosynthesis
MKITFVTSVEDLDGHGGGNQRSKFLLESLTNAAGDKNLVESVVIPYNTFEDLEVDGVFGLKVANDIEFAMKLTWALKNKDKKATKFLEKIKDSDFIVIDNCYHFPIIQTIYRDAQEIPKIVYLSQNHEFSLKSEIAEALQWEPIAKKQYLEFVQDLELKAWENSDFRFVCSSQDAKDLNHDLFPPLENFLVPNGANKRGNRRTKQKNFVEKLGCQSYVIFVSSGHPPNVNGFLELLGSDFGFIPPNSRLVIVGTSGPIIVNEIQGTRYWETFRKRVSVFDRATESELDELYAHCSAVLLPILKGSGTSIKAIEALLTGKKVVGTEFAFRGLPKELFISEQVSLAADFETFRSHVIESLREESIDFEPQEISNDYLWSSQLENASKLFRSLLSTETE